MGHSTGRVKYTANPARDHVGDLVCVCESGFDNDVTDEGVHFCFTTSPIARKARANQVPNTRSRTDTLIFSEEAKYNCMADGVKQFTMKCESDGEFSGLSECNPVQCGYPRPHITRRNADYGEPLSIPI